MENNYQWQGEPVKVEFGNCIVKENKEKPLYWYNYECSLNFGSACIAAIKVTTKTGEQFLMANHFGIGVHKLINGGWPNYRHFSLNGKFSKFPSLKYTEFDEESFANYEAQRNHWQKKNFPLEYARLEALMMGLNNEKLQKLYKQPKPKKK